MAIRIRIPLTNNHNRSYYGPILVGGDPRSLHQVSFDTTAHEIWIPSSRVEGVPDPYTENTTSTYERTPGTHANLHVRGNENVDLTATRRTENFYCSNQGNRFIRSTFCAITEADPDDYYEETAWTGIVGLSFRPPAPYPYSPPIWQIMKDRNLFNGNAFSLWMRNYQYAGDDGGQIIFGGACNQHFNVAEGHVHYDVVEDCDEWMIHMFNVSVGDNPVMQCNKALIHSASPYIDGPTRIIQAINRQILRGRRRRRRQQQILRMDAPDDEETPVFTGEEMLTAGNMPNVSFVFYGNDRVYTLRPRDYIVEEAPGIYTSVFRPMHFSNQNVEYFTLGTPFLRCYHSVFNFEERTIGFAPSTP